MKTQCIIAAMLVLVLAVQAPAQNKDAKRSAAERKAIAAIKKLGGTVLLVSKNSRLVDYVLFNNTKVTDAGLVHLKGSAKLRTLYLEDVKVTDAGLVHIKGLTELYHLHLAGTNVTSAGLLHLNGLTKIQYLYLVDTKVGDDGLAHLTGLTKLKVLNIRDQRHRRRNQETPRCVAELPDSGVTPPNLDLPQSRHPRFWFSK